MVSVALRGGLNGSSLFLFIFSPFLKPQWCATDTSASAIGAQMILLGPDVRGFQCIVGGLKAMHLAENWLLQ